MVDSNPVVDNNPVVDSNPAPAMQAPTPAPALPLQISMGSNVPFLNPVDFSLTYPTTNYFITTGATTWNYGSGHYGGSYVTNAGLSASQSQPTPYIDKTKIEPVLEKLRTWAEEFCKDSSYFSPSLDGFSGLLSRQVLKTLKTNIGWAGYPNCIRLAYVNTSTANYALPGQYRHIFCLIKAEEKSDEEYIIDLTANLFGEKPITFVKTTEVDLIEKPWWNPTQVYSTEQRLSAFLQRD